MNSILRTVVVWGTKYPSQCLLLAAVLSVLGGMLGANLDISTSRRAMVSETEPHWQRYLAFTEEFGVPEELIIFLEGDDPKQVRATSEEIAQALAKYPNQVKSIFHRVDLQAFRNRAPLYLGYEQIQGLNQLARTSAFAKLRNESGAAGRLSAINEILERAPEIWSKSAVPTSLEPAFALVDNILGEFSKYVLSDAEEAVPTVTSIDSAVLSKVAGNPLRGSGLDQWGYLSADGGKKAIIFIRPAFNSDSMSLLMPFVELVRETCVHVTRSKKNVKFGLTGLPMIEVDEHHAMTSDTLLTTLIAVLGVLILFMSFFPQPRLLLIALAPILVGVLVTAGFAYVIYGYLNLLSSFFLVILIGMGVDFSIHIIARSVENQAVGGSVEDAVTQAVLTSGRGILTGGFTSAGAFAAVAFSRFQAMAEMGVVASFGLIVTMFSALILIPALIVKMKPPPLKNRPGFGFMANLSGFIVKFRYPLLIISLGLSVYMADAMQKVRFDYSLLNLLPTGTESGQLMTDMVEHKELSANAVVAVVDSIDEARKQAKKFEELPSVHRSASVASFLPGAQENRIAQLQTTLQNIEERDAEWKQQDNSDTKKDDLEEELERILEVMEKLQDVVFRRGDSKSVAHLESSIESIQDIIDEIGSSRDAVMRARVDAFTANLIVYLEMGIKAIQSTIKEGPITPETLPSGVKERFVGKTGKFAVYAFPEKTMWERENLTQFIVETSSASNALTGFPETYWHNTGMVYNGFRQAALYAFIAVFILLLTDLRSFRYLTAGIIPLALGSIWMLGFMKVRAIDYNLANIFALPLILGVGIDNAIHVLHRFKQSGNLLETLQNTGGAITLSSMTTMVGFGSLHFAQHQGMKTLGEILFVGVGCCLVAALITLPAISRILPKGGD